MARENKKNPGNIICRDNLLLFWTHDGKSWCALIRSDDSPMDPWSEDGELPCRIFASHRRYDFGSLTEPERDPSEFWAARLSEDIPVNELAEMLESDGSLKDMYRKACDEEGVTPDENDPVGDVLWLVKQGHAGLAMKALADRAFWLPIWMYEHSGITIKAGTRDCPYSDRWDSGQLGWGYLTKKSVLQSMVPVLDDDGELKYEPDRNGSLVPVYSHPDEATWKQDAADIITGCVKTKDEYLTGEAYGYELFSNRSPDPFDIFYKDGRQGSEQDGWDEEESVWGFLSDDILKSGIAESIGHGLPEALEKNQVRTGKRKEQKTVTYTFVMDKT